MTEYAKFIRNFKNCQECKKLFPDKINLGYTLYANNFSGYKYMIVLQNPLYNEERYYQEKTEADKAKNLGEKVKVHQRYFREWFIKDEINSSTGQNKKFLERFLGLLRKYKLIDYKSVEDYLERNFFKDFFVTDIIKYWGKTKDFKNKHFQHSVTHLIEEINGVRPELIFSFSTRVWDNLYKALMKDYELEPVKGWNYIIKRADSLRAQKKITNLHGHLFKGRYEDDESFFIIPLVHLSARARNNLLRDTYFEFLEEGLDIYSRAL